MSGIRVFLPRTFFQMWPIGRILRFLFVGIYAEVTIHKYLYHAFVLVTHRLLLHTIYLSNKVGKRK